MTQINPKIFKAYDIRGIYPDEINEENIVPIIKAIYTFFLTSNPQPQNPHLPAGRQVSHLQLPTSLSIVLGRDMRISSPVLFDAALKILLEMGANVIDVGLVSTPSFYFSVFHYGYDAGIQITASHNPKEYNGIKFVKNSQNGLIKIGKSTGMDEIKRMVASVNKSADKEGEGTVIKKENILDDEVATALTILNNPNLKKFKIAADPANAMGSQYIDALFQKVPADLIKMNFDLDGNFPIHQPDPLDFENLKDLQKTVLEEKADFGLAPDGDGDRLFFIDEKGQVVPASIITGIVAKEFLKHNPGATILFDIRYILTPRKIVEENGGKYEITKVGHAFITEKMAQTGAVFAGESSAHYFYKANGNAEWQLITILTVMKVLTEENKTLSQLVEENRRSYESGEINFKVDNAQEIMETVKEKYTDSQPDTLDGIAINYPDWRFNIRTSNTEPLLRLNIEGYEKSVMEEKKEELINYISPLKA